MAPVVIGSLAVPAGSEVPSRSLLGRILVGAPLIFLSVADIVRAALLRLLGRPHPIGWTIPEDAGVRLLRVMLLLGDIPVWRVVFWCVTPRGKPAAPVKLEEAARLGGRSVWYSLEGPEAGQKAGEPRGRLNIYYIHGGAFIAGSARQYEPTFIRWLNRLAARGIEAKILSSEYPLAPEHPYPAGRDYCEGEIEWLLKESGDTPVVVAGDSAGGNLVLSALARLRDAGRLPVPPAGVLLISPAVDSSPTSVFSRREGAGEGLHDYLPREKLHQGLPVYYTPNLSDPYVSPTLLESFSGLAGDEMLLMSGGAEVMASDIRVFAKKLRAASDAWLASGGAGGYKFTFWEEPTKPHSWPMMLIPHYPSQQEQLWAFFSRIASGPAAARE